MKVSEKSKTNCCLQYILFIKMFPFSFCRHVWSMNQNFASMAHVARIDPKPNNDLGTSPGRFLWIYQMVGDDHSVIPMMSRT